MTGRPYRAAHSPGGPPFAVGRLGGPRPCPAIATDRLAIGPLTLDDWPAYWSLMGDGTRTVHMGGPFDLPQAWGWFCVDMNSWAMTGSGAAAIRLRDGTLIGTLSLNDLPAFAEPELGWALLAGREGRGHVSEAAAAFLAWIRAEVRPPSLVSYVGGDNVRSANVARRLGAVPDDAAWVPEPGDRAWRHDPAAPAADPAGGGPA